MRQKEQKILKNIKKQNAEKLNEEKKQDIKRPSLSAFLNSVGTEKVTDRFDHIPNSQPESTTATSKLQAHTLTDYFKDPKILEELDEAKDKDTKKYFATQISTNSELNFSIINYQGKVSMVPNQCHSIPSILDIKISVQDKDISTDNYAELVALLGYEISHLTKGIYEKMKARQLKAQLEEIDKARDKLMKQLESLEASIK
jgi:hypothetical protein